VDAMWQEERCSYTTGTKASGAPFPQGCASGQRCFNYEALRDLREETGPFTATSQTMPLLAGLSSLKRQIQTMCFVIDEMSATDYHVVAKECHGVRCSTAAQSQGMQLERTATTVMALGKLLRELKSVKQEVPEGLQDAHQSMMSTLRRLLTVKGGWVPGAVRGSTDSGFGETYFHSAHLASTIWAACAIGYEPQLDLGPADPKFNLFQALGGRIELEGPTSTTRNAEDAHTWRQNELQTRIALSAAGLC